MLRTLPESLQQKLQPRVVTGMPGDSLRRQAQEQASSGNVSGAIATLRQGVPAIRTMPGCASIWPDCCKNPATTARPRRDGRRLSSRRQQQRAVCRRAVCQRERRLAAGADAAGADSRRQPDQPDARFASAGELQPAAGDREDYLAQGNTVAASNTLAMAATPPKAPADVGKLARLLARAAM
jgi:hypothetical protein